MSLSVVSCQSDYSGPQKSEPPAPHPKQLNKFDFGVSTHQTDMFINKVLLAKELSLKFNTRSPFANLVKDREIRAEFDEMLAGRIPTMSRSDMAKHFEVSEGFLKSRYSILCECLSAAHTARLEHDRENLVEQFTIALGRVRSHHKKWTVANAIVQLNDPSIIEGMSDIDLVLPFEKAKVKLRDQDEARKLREKDRHWKVCG